MYDQVTPRRRMPLAVLAWVLAVLLGITAVIGTLWVLTRDVSAPQGAPTQSPTQGTTASATAPGPSPSGAVGQQWTASASGELRTLGSMCLDDPGGGAADTPVIISTCHGGANQQWGPQADGTIRNVATGLCLDVSEAATDNETPVIVYDCHAGDNQRWSTTG